MSEETKAEETKLEQERKKIDSLTNFSNMYDFKKEFKYSYRTEAGLTPDVVREISEKKG